MLADTVAKVLNCYRAGDPGNPYCRQYETALAAAGQADQDGVATAELYNTIWHIRYLRGDYQEALEDLERALRLRPDLASAHYHRGLVYRRLGDAGKARNAFLQAQKLAVAASDDGLVDALEHYL